jgi:hypothetical protein
VELRFQLQPLTDRDTKANLTLDAFRFDQKPLTPLILQPLDLGERPHHRPPE